MILRIDDNHYVNMDKVSSIEIKKIKDKEEWYIDMQFDSVRNELMIDQEDAERIATELSIIAKREFAVVNPKTMQGYCMEHSLFYEQGVCPNCVKDNNK